MPSSELFATEAVRIGQLLRQGRAQKGLTVDDVACDLHLQPRQIMALEKGDYSAFSSPAIVKGHLRACARLYVMDGNALVQILDAALPRQKSPPPQPAATPVRITGKTPAAQKHLVLASMVLILFVALFSVYWLVLRPLMSADVSGAAQVVPSMTSTVPPSPFLAEPVPASRVTLSPDPLTTPGLPAETPGVKDQADKETVPTVGSSTTVSDAILHIEFLDDCVVRLKSGDDNTLHDRKHRKGEIFDMAVKPPLHVWFSKGTAVTVTFNGVAVPVPVKPGFQSVDFVLGDEPSPGDNE